MTIFNLVRFELTKLFKTKYISYFFLAFFLIIAAYGVLLYSNEYVSTFDSKHWKEELMKKDTELLSQLNSIKDEIESDETNELLKSTLITEIQEQLLIDEYRLKHNIPPETELSPIDILIDYNKLVGIIVLFVMVIASFIVAQEFEYGTINTLLLKKFTRFEIILSKYITIISILILFFFILFSASYAIGIFISDYSNETFLTLKVIGGEVYEYSKIVPLIESYLLNFIVSISYVTIAFFFSCLFYNRYVALIFSILALIFAQSTNLLIEEFSWSKYWLFQNTNYEQFTISSITSPTSNTLFSSIVVLTYIIILVVVSFIVFCKKDIRV